MAVRAGNAQAVSSSINHSTSVAALPAVNRPRLPNGNATTTSLSTKNKTAADQLAALSKYSSRIAKIDVPYNMGVSVNRKGPSSYANAKDKSDRATSEQVLDPRTRIILFKMIGRGLIQEVNGCISTGKEVEFCPLSSSCQRIRTTNDTISRLMYIMPSLLSSITSPSRFTRPLFLSLKTETNT